MPPLLLGGVLVLLASAAPPVRAQNAASAPLHLAYEGFAAGLNVVHIQAQLQESPNGYGVTLGYQTGGLVGALIHAQMDTRVQGVWAGDAAQPVQFYSYGHLRGQPRRTWIDYARGQPEIRDLQPPNDAEREPVPPELEAHTIDTLSAMALLIRRIERTGRCDGEATTYDGRRLARLTVRTVGEERLAPTHGSSFDGEALRCDFEGHQLAGFLRDADAAQARRPRRGIAWFARVVPGEPPVPVRLQFETPWVGSVNAYLTRAQP